MRKFNFNETASYSGEIPFKSGNLRFAYIEEVDPVAGTVDIKWLDHPTRRKGVQINQSAFGSYEFPVAGAIVLVAVRPDGSPEIVRYITTGYSGHVSAGNVEQLKPGEKLFVSYKEQPNEDNTHPLTPQTTGTQIKMDAAGKVIISTGSGDSWIMDPNDDIIKLNSMNYQVSTEAGILDFGIIYDEDRNIITENNLPLPIGKPFTEFRLRVLETSDLNPLTPPETDDPFVELTLGTKANSDRDDTEKTTSDDAVSGKEIIIELKTKANIGFKFVVDKDGNVTMRVIDGKKFKLACDDIELGGDGEEQSVLLKKMFTTKFLGHKHIGNNGSPTSGVIPPHSIDTNSSSPSDSNIYTVSTKAE